MPVVADTPSLVSDGVITQDQAQIIESRAREIMVNLSINVVLCFGILATTAGLIGFLADALAVAITGSILVGGGLLILARSSAVYRMFGNAAALIGSGMLIGGGFIELVDKYEPYAGPLSMLLSLPIIFFAGRSLLIGGLTTRFVAGSILLMGVALHLAGLGQIMTYHEMDGFPVALSYLYASVVIFAAGWTTDVRTITALAIAPFAQMLDTSTSYFHAAYVFYSPESTLSILQMSVLIAACVWAAPRVAPKLARHLGITAIMAFIVANLCALVGSLWGDEVGQYIWGPRGRWYNDYDSWEAYDAAYKVFMENAIVISEGVYTIAWAAVLALLIFWAAHKGKRGLFNTAVTFAAIHAYTQMFESYGDEPLAYVICGATAIPLAWGMWRLNLRYLSDAKGA